MTRPLSVSSRTIGRVNGNHHGLPFLAHTYWSGLRTEQWWDCPGLYGLEVWNSGCQLELGRGDASIHWDEALEHGRPCFALATDDSHHPGFDSDLAWVWARTSERSQPAVLEALATGSFYSSTGPVIHAVTVEDKEVLLLALAVIHRHRLARLQDVQVDAELLESGVVALEAAVLAERAVGPLGVSGVEHEPVGHDWSSGSSAPSGVGSDMSS